MDESAFDRVFSAAAGVWALAAMAAVALFKAWPSILERVNERKRDAAAEKAGDWMRIRDEVHRLDGRVKALEQECAALRAKVLECEEDRELWRGRANAAEAEVIRLEAYHQGTGEARQAAQNILSIERDQDSKKRD